MELYQEEKMENLLKIKVDKSEDHALITILEQAE